MKKKIRLNSIELNSIDVTDRTYLFSPLENEVPEEKLVKSIRNFGILTPPVLLRKESKHIIVCGWKRIMAMRKIKPNATIQALTLPPTAEKTDVLLLIAEQNSFRDKLSQAEQASFFKAYLEQKPLAEALPLLEKFGYKPQKHVLQSLLDLLKLDKSALIAVHEGTIALKAAPKLLKLASPDQKLLVEIIKSLHLGGSKQQKLLDYCTELLMRTNEPLSTLLTPFFEGDKLADTDNIPQKAGALITWLHKKCYPRSTVAEEEFKTSVNKLNLPNHIQLDHTPSFEDDKVILSVSFQNLQEAANSLSQLQNTPGKTSN